MTRCPFCREQSADSPPPISLTFDMNCQNCGSFRITKPASDALQENEPLAFHIGCWVYEQNQLGSAPLIDTKTLELIKQYPCPNIKKRAELYLGRAIRLLDNKLTGRIQIGAPALRVASWSFFREDTTALAKYSFAIGRIRRCRKLAGVSINCESPHPL
jgi:hypothetical protein